MTCTLTADRPLVRPPDLRARSRGPARESARADAHFTATELEAESRRVGRWTVPRAPVCDQRRVPCADVDFVGGWSARCGSRDHAGLVRPMVHSKLYRAIVGHETGPSAKKDSAGIASRAFRPRTVLQQQPQGARARPPRSEVRRQPCPVQEPLHSSASVHGRNRSGDRVGTPTPAPASS